MAAHKLPRLSKSLLDTPQLITESKFREIAEVLENRDSSMIKAALESSRSDDSENGEYVSSWGEGIGVLDVEGSLTYKPTGWEALCSSGTNYTDLMATMDSLASDGIKTVIMQLDSPGGQAFRCFSTGAYIRKVADANDMKIIGYVNGQACSGGMVLASVCDELIANPDSEVGSIGVVISLTDTSKRDEKEGIKRHYITAGKSKVPYEEDGSFKEEFKSDLQEKILKTYEKFITHVSTFRGLDPEVVRGTEAKVFDSEEALTLGLIDKIMEEDEFKEYINSNFKALGKTRDSITNVALATNIQKEKTLMSEMNITAEELAEMQSALATLKAENEKKQAELEAFKAKEMASVKEGIKEKLNSFTFLSNLSNKDSLVELLMNSEDSNAALMNEVLEAAQMENTKVIEEAAEQVANKETELQEAIQAKEAAELEASRVKEDFGKQTAVEGDVKDKDVTVDASSGAARTAQLAKAVEARLANK